MPKPRILVVDDDSLFRESVVETLVRQGYELVSASSGPEALQRLREDVSVDLIISDLKMAGMSGIELLEQVRKIDQDVPFLMLTAYGGVGTAVEAMQKGAHDFVEKASLNMISELEMRVAGTLKFRSLVKENRQLKSALQKKWDYIGSGPAMDKIRQLVNTVAQSRSTVLVSGESGTGKELIARSIHYQSPRHNGPFIKVNCAALPEGLIESELFGHERGAFTGALTRKRGKFELASGGTLLLDEIGEMSGNVQAKLLRVLQEREINKVGGDEPVEVDVRVVATTNRELGKEVESGRFREDLYYRLNVFHIHLPPLRERKNDIPRLVQHLVQKVNDENGFSLEGVAEDCLSLLTSYDWPGNIRELENAIERAAVLTRSGTIGRDVLDLAPSRGGGSVSGFQFKPGVSIAGAEKELILRTLDSCGNNRTKAAEMLGISIRTLRNKLNEYGGKEG